MKNNNQTNLKREETIKSPASPSVTEVKDIFKDLEKDGAIDKLFESLKPYVSKT
jgi:hypothetical protein